MPTTVAFVGQPAAGFPDGVNYESFSIGARFTDDSHIVQIAGRVSGPGIDVRNESVVWLGPVGSLQPVIREGDPAPGFPTDSQFSDRPHANLLGNGDGVVVAGTNRSSSQHLWTRQDGQLELIAGPGFPAPGTPDGVTFRSAGDFLAPDFQDPRNVAFRAALRGPGIDFNNESSLWFGGPDELTLIARYGDPAPGGADGDTFGNFSLVPGVGRQGEVYFHSFLRPETPDPNTQNRWGAWVFRDGEVLPVAVPGQAAPGAAGTFFEDIDPFPSTNDTGEVVLTATLLGRGSMESRDSGLWIGTADGLRLAAREGDDAPDQVGSVQFGQFDMETKARINDAGQVAFQATLTGPDASPSQLDTIYSDGSGELALVAMEREQPPGASAGVRFATFSEIALNSFGQVAFDATLIGGPFGNSNDGQGVWAQDRAGNLQLIAMSGQEIDVDNSPDITDLRTISQVNGARSINDRGQVLFWTRFTDGSSGIFLSNAVAVPEPGAGPLLLSLLAGSASRCARRRPNC